MRSRAGSGNLKQYKLGTRERAARDAGRRFRERGQQLTGFITECARSFWTPTTADTYWAFQLRRATCLAGGGLPETRTIRTATSSRRARRPTQLRAPTTARTPFKTCSALRPAPRLIDFNSTNVTQADLGAASTAEHDQLISWALGPGHRRRAATTETRNCDGRNAVPRSTATSCTRARWPSTCGTDASPEVVVFYGGNDGVLRAVNGNRDRPSHRRRRRRRRDVGLHAARVLSAHQAAARQH